MFDHELLERIERRVRNIQFRTIRMENNIMGLREDVDALKASTSTLLANLATYQASVNQTVAAAVAADEAGEDVDIQKLKSDIDAANATIAPAVATAQAAAGTPTS